MTREEAIEILLNMANDLQIFPESKQGQAFKMAIKALEQKPKTGHWFIGERPESDREIICSNCEQTIFRYHKLDFDYRPNYCPNCGAEMIESRESELENPFNDSRFGG